MNRKPFEIDEWYHCYSRGVDKRKTFLSRGEYERFLEALYLCNSDRIVERNLARMSHREILLKRRGNPLVSVGAYCLMPNHFHMLFREVVEGGIARFMQKVGTSYGMYFNIKHERTGNVFVKPFRSKHLADEVYLRHVLSYIHLNPADLYEPQWKKGAVRDRRKLERALRSYPYSSLRTYIGEGYLESVIIDPDASHFLKDIALPFPDAMKDAIEYYREVPDAT